MRNSMFAFSRLSVVVLLVSGCAAIPHQQQQGVAAVKQNAQSDVAATRIGEADIGSRVSLPVDNDLGVPSVIVAANYTAASGRPCRRLLASDSKPIARVACQRRNGQWYFSRSLQSKSSQRVLDAAVSVNDMIIVPANAVGNTVVLRLRQDETLWTFAERVTGNAENWAAIASHNSVNDTAVLKAGAMLIVPPELFFTE